MRILTLCGSLQASSKNSALLESAARLAPADVDVVAFEGLRNLPHFDPDLEIEATIPVVDAWRSALRGSDALLIASPEYGHSLPGALKNGIDWVIGSGELYEKPVAITAAVPSRARGRRGLDALATTLRGVAARIVSDRAVLVGDGADAELLTILNLVVHAARDAVAE